MLYNLSTSKDMVKETYVFLRFNVSLKTIPTRQIEVTTGVKYQVCTYVHIADLKIVICF